MNMADAFLLIFWFMVVTCYQATIVGKLNEILVELRRLNPRDERTKP